MSLDLASLDTTVAAESGSVLTLEHPVTGRPLETTLTLAGADSAVYRKTVNAALKRRKGRFNKITMDEIDEEAIERLARCTLNWSGVVVDGETLPCTLDNARILYRRFPWIKEQTDTFISDRANFLRD